MATFAQAVIAKKVLTGMQTFGQHRSEGCEALKLSTVKVVDSFEPTSVRPSFCAEAQPPMLPDGPFDSVEQTSIDLVANPGITISALGNTLLNALHETAQSGGDVKVDYRVKDYPGKFSVKATVCMAERRCRVKVKFYAVRGEVGSYVIELQHRSGDEHVFQEFYGKAVHCYAACKDCTASPRTAVVDISLQERNHYFAPRAGEASEVLAILDTAGFCEVHDLQLQAALALARAADDCQLAAKLCSDKVCESVRVMMRSDSADVQWPLALFLAKVQKVCKTDALIASLHADLEQKTFSENTCPLVKGLLQEVLSVRGASPKQKPAHALLAVSDEVSFIAWMEPDDFLTMENYEGRLGL